MTNYWTFVHWSIYPSDYASLKLKYFHKAELYETGRELAFKIKRYPIGIASVSTYWFMYRKRKHCDALVRPGKEDNDPPQHTFPALTVWDRSFSLFLRWPRDTVSFSFCLSSPNWSFKLWFMAWNRNKNVLQYNHAFNFWMCPAEAWYYKYILAPLGLLLKLEASRSL